MMERLLKCADRTKEPLGRSVRFREERIAIPPRERIAIGGALFFKEWADKIIKNEGSDNILNAIRTLVLVRMKGLEPPR